MRSIASVDVMRKVLSQIEDPGHLLWGDLNQASAGLMKAFLEALAVSEVESRVGAKLYERRPGRRDYRNGYRERELACEWQYLFLDAAFRQWGLRWRLRYPGVVASVEEDLGHLLAFFGCPALHREYVRTTNPIERAFRELRRQMFGCGALANRESCNRAVYRVFSWLNDRWCGRDIWEIRRRRENKQQPQRAA